MRYTTKYLKIAQLVFYFIISLFAGSFSVLSNLDDDAFDNSFSDGPALTCKDTVLLGTVPESVSNCLENIDSDTYISGINGFERSYLSSHYSDSIGVNSDVPCVHAIPFTDIVLNSIVLNAINQYLPKLTIIKSIFIPPRPQFQAVL